MATATVALTAFAALTSHLKQWFYKPDIEALEITLAVAASHYAPGDPTWLFLVAPPATGKTSAGIQVLKTADKAYVVGDLTPNTFLSGKTKTGRGDISLLERRPNAIFLMKDFTTMISKRPDDRAMIASQLREVYDGAFNKDTGESGRLCWQGKVTVIAACTPAIERQWGLLRDLGERFMTVRWKRESGLHAGTKILRQRGHELDIGAKTSTLGKQLLDMLPKDRPDLPDHMYDRIIGMSELVARARGHVTRDNFGSRDIINIDECEGTSRILKALASLLVNYPALFGRECLDEDMRIATRLAMNSIPHARSRILSVMPPNAPIDFSHILMLTEMIPASLQWQLDELEALSILVRTTSGTTVSYALTSNMQEIWQQAFPSTT